jgi:hypothetical protein
MADIVQERALELVPGRTRESAENYGSSGNLVGRCVNRAFSVIFRHERNNDKPLSRIARIGSKLEGDFGRLSTGEQVG